MGLNDIYKDVSFLIDRSCFGNEFELSNTGQLELSAQIVDDFRRRSFFVTARIVPIETQLLGSLDPVDFTQIIRVKDLMLERIGAFSTIEMSEEEMVFNLMKDRLQRDVPYLSEKEGILCWGSPQKNVRIGEKKC